MGTEGRGRTCQHTTNTTPYQVRVCWLAEPAALALLTTTLTLALTYPYLQVRACWLAEPAALAPLTTLGTSYSLFQRVIVHITEDFIQ